MTAVDMWSEVAELMRSRAKAKDDAFLYHVAEAVDGDIFDHKEGAVGCAACQGRVGSCGRWDSAQELMLTWLIQQAVA